MSVAKRATSRIDPIFGSVRCLAGNDRATVVAMSSSDSAAALVALRRIIRVLRLADREAETTYGLTAAQLFVLLSLAESPAGSMAELAERTLTDQSSVSIVVSRLERKRLVVRKPSPDDRRRVQLKLKPAGKKIAAAGPDVPQPKIIDAIDAMPPAKRTEVVRALEQLARAIGAEDVEPTMLFEDDEPKRRKR